MPWKSVLHKKGYKPRSVMKAGRTSLKSNEEAVNDPEAITKANYALAKTSS
jgi:hypothetical protein